MSYAVATSFLSLYEYGLAGLECLSDLLPSAGVTAPLSAHSSPLVLLQQGSHSPHCEDVSLFSFPAHPRLELELSLPRYC